MKIKNLFVQVLIGLLGAAFFGLSISAAEMKIAIVDMQRALQTVDAGKKAKATLEKEFNEKKKVLQKEEEAIKKSGEDFKKKSMVMSEDAKAKTQGEIQERIMKFQELYRKSQVDMQTRERELTDPIISKLRTVIEEMGKGQGYSLILERNENSVLFMQSKDDLTEEVIKQFNKKNG